MNAYNVHSRQYGDSTEAQAQLLKPCVRSGWRPSFFTNGVHAPTESRDHAGRPVRHRLGLHKGPSPAHRQRPTGTVVSRLRSGGWDPQRSPTVRHLTSVVTGQQTQRQDQHYSAKNWDPRWAGPGERQRRLVPGFARAEVRTMADLSNLQHWLSLLYCTGNVTPGPAWVPLRHLRKKKPPAFHRLQ